MKSPKKRDAAATKQRILLAAQQVFHEQGYDGATTREIARRADVNMALISRYFGSKKGLFEQAVIPYLNIGWLVENGLEGAPERLVDNYLNTAPWTTFDPVVVCLRSASSTEAGPLLRKAMREQVLQPLMGAIDGADNRARAILIVTQLSGLIAYFRILGETTETQEETDVMRRYLTTYFTDLLGHRD